jgi:cytidylate kinase
MPYIPLTLTQLTSQIGEKLQSFKMQLCTAESCSGGKLAETMTDIPGSSAWFERGFVTYSNAAKQDLLDVQTTTLQAKGAVSEETAIEMAKGALAHSPAHLSIAITGIAGPEGGSEEKPLGTVWIAWAARGSDCIAKLFKFSGDRAAVRQQAVYAALTELLSILSGASALLPPVITLDGPSGTGKGTLCYLVAKQLGWHYLDSGASFRVLAYAALQKNIELTNEQLLQQLAQTLDFEFAERNTPQMQVLLEGINITDTIRSEACGNAASKIATLPLVRQALLERQRNFRKWPGLVTDGRDMGTVIFPQAKLKFFLQASAAERAKRRYNQLKSKELHATLAAILQDLEERDKRDKERNTAPLKPASDALFLDTTHHDIETSFGELMRHVESIT